MANYIIFSTLELFVPFCKNGDNSKIQRTNPIYGVRMKRFLKKIPIVILSPFICL